jgi:hypothetical protein
LDALFGAGDNAVEVGPEAVEMDTVLMAARKPGRSARRDVNKTQ